MDGQEIRAEDYERYMKAAKRRKGEHLFKVWMRAALAWFEDRGAKIALIETGIGGRKDCTNKIDAKIAVITPISLDHTRILGDTVEKNCAGQVRDHQAGRDRYYLRTGKEGSADH